MNRIPLLACACMLSVLACTDPETPTDNARAGNGSLSGFHDGTHLVAWVDQFGGASGDHGFESAADASGVYAVGSTSGDLDGPHAGANDAYVRKYDHDGNVLWTEQFGSPRFDAVNGVALDGSAVYVAGVTRGVLDDPTTNRVFHDGFLRRYDPAGNMIWSRQFGTDSDDYVWGVAAAAGAVYVGGMTSGALGGPSSGAQDSFLFKYDPDGTLLWTLQFGPGMGDDVSALHADASGVYVTGRTTVSVDITGVVVDAYLRKYDVNGNLLWSDQFGNAGFALGLGVAADAAGIYVVGLMDGAFVRRYSPEGVLLWTRGFATPEGGGLATAVAADESGVYVGGEAGGRIGATHAGGTDVFARKYDPAGEIQWTVQVGTPEVDQANGIAVHDGVPYLVGHTTGDFATHLGALDAFTARLDPLIPAEQVEHLRSAVDGLTGIGAGQKNSLVAKLEAARARIAEGNPEDAISALRAFINEVEAMVRSGRLSTATGQALIDAATAAIVDLGG